MSNYKIGLQRAKGGHKVVLYSADNGKLVLAGEVIKNIVDACNVESDLANGWNNKRNELAVELEVFPASKKWPANSGPKKQAAPKKAVQTKTSLRVKPKKKAATKKKYAVALAFGPNFSSVKGKIKSIKKKKK